MPMTRSLGATRTLNDLSLRDAVGYTRSPMLILEEPLIKAHRGLKGEGNCLQI